MNVEEFVKKSRLLISKEREAEVEESRILQENVPPKLLEHRGVCILHLRIASRHMGLYGRTVLVMEPHREMPSHNLTPGDIVGLSLSSQGDNSSQKTIDSGIIFKVGQSSISVAFDESHDLFDLDDQVHYQIIKLANDVTYRRLQKALDLLDGGKAGSRLVNVLFGVSEFGEPLQQKEELSFINENLDESQKDAVRFALCQREVAIIHGPPGTGKTTTVTEIILQAVRSGLKVLVSAPSNIAVDNLVERLASSKRRLVRLGHPARLLPTIQRYSLDAIVASSDETRIVEDVRADINKSLGRLRNVRNKGERRGVRDEIKHLRKELRRREDAAVDGILKKADVVLATLTMASEDGPLGPIDDHKFDLVVIDECSQALEVACWIALVRGNRCVLAGDHNQLPPTILSQTAARDGLAVTLMERLVRSHEDRIVRMLTTQYRMHNDIMSWASKEKYDGKLVAHASVSSHLLRDLTGVSDVVETNRPLLLIDTSGCDLIELTVPDGASKGNEGEADITVAHVEKLISCGVAPADIAVIAPYNLQVEFLRLRLSQKYPTVEIKSVDGFQGREKEAVVISLVRSNDKGEVGFLAEDRRINVAVTRARRHLAVVCDTETVCHDAFIKSLVDHMTAFGEVRSAQEYIEDGALNLEVRRPEHLEILLQSSASKSQPAVDQRKKPGKGGKKENVQSRKPAFDGKNEEKKEKIGLTTMDETCSGSDSTIRETELRQVLFYFLQNESVNVHPFLPSLTSHDRYLVHEIAEELKLVHVSKGDGSERFIEVSRRRDETDAKTTTTTAAKSSASPPRNEKIFVDESVDLRQRRSQNVSRVDDDAVATKRCCVCGRDVPSANYDLHSVRCRKEPCESQPPLAASSKVDATSPNSDDNVQRRPLKVKSGKNSEKRKNVEPPPSTTTEEDFDALVEAASKENRRCHHERCKNVTTTLGQDCPFCRRRFCLTHHIPEAHDCGDRARQHARAVISREGVLYRGSGVPSKKSDAVRHAQLERRLDKKLSDLAEQRKPKPKQKDK